MTDPSPRQVTSWKVLRVEDTTAIVGVTPMAVKRVWLKLFDGSETYVDVPRESFTAGAVAQLADDVARKHFEVVTLQGPEISLGS